MKRYKTVDEFIKGQASYRKELIKLRKAIQSTGLEETMKWGAPCYTYNGKNVVGIGAFKSYVGLWFHQGALLKDPKKKLINAQENKTKALRQWRFGPEDEIDDKTIKAYILEAIENVKSGREIKPERKKSLELPELLVAALRESAKVKKAYEALTPGKQREYAEYIAEAKREETKARRLEKILPMILDGKGLNDRYT